MAQRQRKSAAEKKPRGVSRRDFIKSAAAGVLAAGLGANIIIPGRAGAGNRTLRILTYGHFVPGYDRWFDAYVKKWGEKNDTAVTVDRVMIGPMDEAAAEVKAGKGHDLFYYAHWAPAAFEEHVIDHREIYQECEKKYGKAISLAIKDTYNPRTDNYYGFCQSYVPNPVSFRKDLWDGVGMSPDTWEDVRLGGVRIKKKYGNPVGIALGSCPDGNSSLLAIMYSFGASVQDQEGNVAINSRETLEAVKFVRALYEEAMPAEVVHWDNSSNNGFMLEGHGSLTLNPVSITRWAENQKMTEMSKNIWLAKSPAGPVRRMATPNITTTIFIWKFAENIEGAKQFLVDYIGSFREAFIASEFYEFPSFPATVPDLKELLARDPKADPPDKYKVLADAQDWTADFGYPGYANAAIDEILGTYVIRDMFAKVCTGKAPPAEAIKETEARCKEIFAAWRAKGLL